MASVSVPFYIGGSNERKIQKIYGGVVWAICVDAWVGDFIIWIIVVDFHDDKKCHDFCDDVFSTNFTGNYICAICRINGRQKTTKTYYSVNRFT